MPTIIGGHVSHSPVLRSLGKDCSMLVAFTCQDGLKLTGRWSPITPSSTAYMRPWIGSALVQIMACRLFGAKPLHEPMMGYYHIGTIKNKLQWNFNPNTELFIQENVFESVVCQNGRHFVPGVKMLQNPSSAILNDGLWSHGEMLRPQ